MHRNDFFYWLQSILGAYPSLYFPAFARKYPFNQMAVAQDTQICIEGFPRSANSYAVVAFRVANPDVKIAHHLHVPAQLIQATGLGIPSVLLIRKPEEAVASFLVFQQSDQANLYLKTYIRFHKALRKLRHKLIVADFELAITNMNAIIKAVNEKFAKDFHFLQDQSKQESVIFAKLKEVNDQFFAGQKNKSMYPDENRKQAKKEARKLVLNSRRLPAAQAIYKEFLQDALQLIDE